MGFLAFVWLLSLAVPGESLQMPYYDCRNDCPHYIILQLLWPVLKRAIVSNHKSTAACACLVSVAVVEGGGERGGRGGRGAGGWAGGSNGSSRQDMQCSHDSLCRAATD